MSPTNHCQCYLPPQIVLEEIRKYLQFFNKLPTNTFLIRCLYAAKSLFLIGRNVFYSNLKCYLESSIKDIKYTIPFYTDIFKQKIP